MFGYIVPEKPELKVREYELYRGYYCGICKAIGRSFGQLPRLTLNYDSVLLAMMVDGLLPERPEISMERCIVHPVQKRAVVKNNAAAQYAADMHILLSYYKLKDDFDDERSLKGMAGCLYLKKSMKRLMKKYDKTCIIVKEALAELSGLEKAGCPSLDQVSEPFARLMEVVFSPPCEDEQKLAAFRRLGFHLGKWIYILDAYDDLEKDRQSGAYNPFVCMEQGDRPLPGGTGVPIKERAEFNLMYHLGEMSSALDLLAPAKNREIMENILYLGMLKKTEEVLEVHRVKGEKHATKSI